MPIVMLEAHVKRAQAMRARDILDAYEAAAITNMKKTDAEARLKRLHQEAELRIQRRPRTGRRIEELKLAGIGDVIE